MLPALDTAYFDAVLPLMSRAVISGAILPQETRLALKVLAAPEPHDDDADAMTRIEAKLDLALEIALKVHHPQRPLARTCRIGLTALAWEDIESYQPGDEIELLLFPNSDSALALTLPITIVQADTLPTGALYLGEFKSAFDEPTRLMWEKWVFRCHRRSLQKR
jgi:hypothetical protein